MAGQIESRSFRHHTLIFWIASLRPSILCFCFCFDRTDKTSTAGGAARNTMPFFSSKRWRLLSKYVGLKSQGCPALLVKLTRMSTGSSPPALRRIHPYSMSRFFALLAFLWRAAAAKALLGNSCSHSSISHSGRHSVASASDTTASDSSEELGTGGGGGFGFGGGGDA